MSKASIPVLFALIACGCKPPRDVTDARNPSSKAAAPVAALAGLEAYPGAIEVSRKEHDEGGFHIAELALSTPDLPAKVAAFYEPRVQAKAMPIGSGLMSIQNDIAGNHYQIDFGRFNEETTISITIKSAAP